MQFRSLVDPPDLAGFGNCALERRKGFLAVGQVRWTAVKVSNIVHLLSFKHLHDFMKLVFNVKTWSQESSCFLSTLFIPLI